jgi:WD40 repeat protein
MDIWKMGAWAVTLAFSPDGKTLALAEWGKTISLRDVATGREIGKLQGHKDKVVSVAFSPDGKVLASASWDGTVRLWDVAAAKEVRRLDGHEGSVRCVAFAPRGRYVASAGDDGTVRLWELASGRECGRFTGHVGDVCALAFSPEGRRLASSGTDHTALIWDLTGRNGGPVPAARLGPEDLERLWSDLASTDAARAYRAGCLLASVPDRAVDLLRRRLREHLKPVDTLRFVLGREAANDPGLESRESEDLRIVRAVTVLEQMGTDKAKELLRGVAERARQAQAGIDRELGQHP